MTTRRVRWLAMPMGNNRINEHAYDTEPEARLHVERICREHPGLEGEVWRCETQRAQQPIGFLLGASGGYVDVSMSNGGTVFRFRLTPAGWRE